MFRHLAIATILPVALLISLFLLIDKARVQTSNFERDYLPMKLEILKKLDNPGIVKLQKHGDALYGTDYRSIYSVEFPSLRPKRIAGPFPKPITDWGFRNDTLLVLLANSRTLYYAGSKGEPIAYLKFNIPVSRAFFMNDSMLIVKCPDTSFTNAVFYSYNMNTFSFTKLKDMFRQYNDGGIAIDGEFTDAGNKLIHLQWNMGRFALVNKNDLAFSASLPTIDNNASPPPVIQFAGKGFRLDTKFSRTNIAGFVDDSCFYILSNAYNKREYYGGTYKVVYPVDVYDLKTHKYRHSFTVPKNSMSNGSLLSVERHKNCLILVYLRKILIVRP